MPFQIRMGVPEMDQLWLDISTRSLQGGLDKEEQKFFKKLLIMDESSGRAMARNLNTRITGTLGVLLKAKRDGEITSLKFEMDRLVRDAGSFVSDRVQNTFLAEAGWGP
jgi:hypothetical protein